MRTMKKIEHILFLALVVGALLLASSGCASLPIAKADELTDVGNLRREVQLLNLLNGLELSADQMRFVLEKAQEAQEVREEFKDKADGNIEETTEVLSELRDILMRGENILDSSRERWYSTHSKNLELRSEYEEEMTRIAREVQGILEGHQIYALEYFVPCVIPPQGGARIGQAEDTTAAEGVLARIRAIPTARFERNKEEIARRIMEWLKSHLPRGFALAINEEEETARILAILEEVKGLSDVEFELQKTDLVQQVKSAYKFLQAPVDICLRIERHLLDPKIIPLLEEKLALTV
jgi:outer membrane murein-binding lipoprotein Lpp